jgi:hypothetical protein
MMLKHESRGETWGETWGGNLGETWGGNLGTDGTFPSFFPKA